MMENDDKAVEIFLIEDNPGDIRLTEEALKEGKILHNLVVARDGIEATNYFQKIKESKVRRPDIILLDLNLPKKDGREVLGEIKSDKDLHRIPVVILSTSEAEQDIVKAYDLNANCYITKPVDLEQFLQIVKSIEDFWLSIVKLPHE